MRSRRTAFVVTFALSIGIHVLLGATWSAYRVYTVQNMAEPRPSTFLVKLTNALGAELTPITPDVLNSSPALQNFKLPRKIDPVDLPSKTVMAPIPILIPSLPSTKQTNENAPADNDPTVLPTGPFQSKIDPKKAWINVAESVNYDLLRGIGMDVSEGEYRLPDEVDQRIRAKGELILEYPLIAAAMGQEAVVYVLVLIDQQGQKKRVQIARGDPAFNDTVLQALEKIEFRPAIIKQAPVRSLLLLEFEFRRNPPEAGSF
jgi:TonB family protein